MHSDLSNYASKNQYINDKESITIRDDFTNENN